MGLRTIIRPLRAAAGASRRTSASSPGQRAGEVADRAEVAATGGRNNYGRITARFRGGGHKRRFRIIDFKRNKTRRAGQGGQRRVRSRTARRASRSCTTPTARSATSWPRRARRSATPSCSSRNADIKPGNNLPLRFIPLGTTIHNIELKIRRGAQLCRSAGVGAQLMAKEGDWGQVRLPSGEVRRVHLDCRATIGQVGNIEHGSVHMRQGRPHALEGPPPAQPRRHHEPGRSPDGRRRRSFVRWPSPLLAVGPAVQGPEDAREQADRPHDRQAARQEVVRRREQGEPWLVQSKKVRSSTSTS